MKTRFYDRQEDSSPLNGTEVNDVSEFLEIIDMLVDRPPFICELVGENGFSLSFGLGMSVSHAQYCASDGNPPYFMARSKDSNISNKEFEFLIGGTLTPILGRFCIEFDLLKEIVSHFQKTGYRSTLVKWEEI